MSEPADPADPANFRSFRLHRAWLDRQALALLAFGRHGARPGGGFAWLDQQGRPLPDAPVFTWITSRMVHVYALGALLGVPGSRALAEAALAGLTGVLADRQHGGWHHAVEPDGTPQPGKDCYDHAFVVLAATAARAAALPGAGELLQQAQGVLRERFWDEQVGLCRDRWDASFTAVDPYRGLNANMHAVEAMLSLASVTGDEEWIRRAARICRFSADQAAAHDWRLPEHYDAAWRPQLDYNQDSADDQFKPYGATVGHGLEWSRLMLHTEAALAPEPAPWLAEAARRLYDRAVGDGWQADGQPGFVYTTDWDGQPVVRDRMHWVHAEAIGAAAALARRTGERAYWRDYFRYWDFCERFLIDHRDGSWHHQLGPDNRPADGVWSGKPDLYHAFQATLVPRLGLYPMLAAALAEDGLQ